MTDGSGTLSLRGDEEVGRPVERGGPAELPSGALERVTGSPRIEGNSVGLQFEGSDTFDAWLEAIDGARRYVYFENYILRDDRVGRAFREALVGKAREGVPVYVLYDWIGCWATPRRYWKAFQECGVEVRAFNRPSLRDPLGVFQRDHRKLVCVDDEVAFVGGFCVGVEWAGRGSEPPWRDTGAEIRGPAASAAARTFERIWAEVGDPVADGIRQETPDPTPVGDTPVWVIAGEPGRSRVYRTLQLMAVHVTDRIWITDPYFVAPKPVSEALAAAARDGVDVRVLVPGHNNWPWVGSLSRGGYRFLLEAGARLFEWGGPMIHAKTVVADGLWCRIGSSNLNAASLLGNWEIDVGVQDGELARQLEGLFLADLASSVEIVLPSARVALSRAAADREAPEPPKHSLEPTGTLPERLEMTIKRQVAGGKGGVGWRLADLMRAGTTFGDAIAGHRALGREDRTVLGTIAGLMLVVAALAALFPHVVGWILAVLLGWLGLVIGTRAFFQARRARSEERDMHEAIDEVERDA